MEKHDIYNLMYPVGRLEVPALITKTHLSKWKTTIDEFPTILYSKTADLSPKELKYIYRPQGWNVTQVIHHLADSHMNAFIRFKLALTEDHPRIVPYNEGLWAEQADYDDTNTHYAFQIIEGVHAKWSSLLQHMKEDDFFTKAYFHPEQGQSVNLANALAQYDWHCRHHSEHISQAIKFEGRFWE